MGKSAPAAKPKRGVALGVLGMMLLAFFSIVFMLGRHSYFHDLYEHMVHDPRLGHHDQHLQQLVSNASSTTGTKDVAQSSTTTSTAQSEVLSSTSNTKTTDSEHSGTTAKAESNSKKEEAKQPESKPAAQTVTKSTAQEASGKDGLSNLDNQYKPTREMVQKIQQDGYLVVTWANFHYQDFVRTWVAHVKNVGITGYIVGAMDDELLKMLIDMKYNCFSMKSGLTLGDFGWGSKTFAKMGREKIRLVSIFLKLGVNVVIADVDVLWLRNPLPYFSKYQEADILTSSDHLDNTVPDESLEKWPVAASAANIGIMLFREKSLDFVEEWIKIIEADETVWDQNAFNDLFRRGNVVLKDDPKNLFLGYDGKVKMGILPVSVFCSGHTFFTQQLWKKLNLKPYAVHATFQFSGTPGKRNRMREFMLFEDPPSYYENKGGFLTFKMDGLEELIKNGGPRTGQMDLPNVQGHFQLVNHQMVRVRNALAISTLLGRALVVPEMWCGMDRWWAPHAGTIPGSHFQLPFKCPLDHIFDLEGGWTRDLPPSHGPAIPWRESSFLDNPRTPDTIKKNRVVVEICPPGTADCSDGKAPAPVKNGKVRVQAGLMSSQLKLALINTAEFKVLEFTTMNNAFKNFTDAGDWVKFANRMRVYTSIWCCIMSHPGHIHYDMLWDIPHTDKFNKEWTKWEPTTGP
mmetsp:Transcript_17364/g.37489  ORF Transcript_17364/g.37489 Transcript_17364/m.37489 type:complete len:686 (-) Transcript_17364:496-2553(-)|eukprot:CAMPEP_0202901642 /NCGR_PEP_ID=MMETSP1392-20130828/14368_1 /ASSEMBLY_ACC=CAM_ASM_000868 /TAXON_ID=225041 /ORGANISM="Chlamydomonas chlamydogama, Strain SAG 11-48b" /LENGTH=685 /DNA_ID=CAMNT_0049588233 /DNA_START=260 /DNA_END=2317 /DNA_ORIENTATION=-